MSEEEREGQTTRSSDQRRDALVEQILGSAIGALELMNIYVDDRLGLYWALAGGSGATAPELADATGTHERYVREWLEQQAVAGILEVDDVNAEPDTRRYLLPEGHDEVLVDRNNTNCLTPLAQGLVGTARPLARVIEAFKTGGGVPYAEYGEDVREAQAAGNRPHFLDLMGSEWLPAVPDVDSRLRADPPARVADVGCGLGWSSIAIARAYPKVRVDGFDLDEESIAGAKANAKAEGVAGRVKFQVRGAADPRLSGRYHLAIAIHCIHDMSKPVEALRAMRSLLGERGTAIVVESRVAETFVAPGDELERYCYGVTSCTACRWGWRSSPLRARAP